MTLRCKLCGKEMEVAAELAEGQHVRCPYCGRKFEYSSAEQETLLHGFPRAKARVVSAMPVRKFPAKPLIIGAVAIVALTVLGLMVGQIVGGTSAGIKFDRQSVDAESCPIGETSIEAVLTSAEPGSAYFYSDGNLTVQQVVPKCGVLVGSSSGHSPVAFVLTERNYIDGVELRPGLYACIGTARYPNKDGFIRTVLAFEEAEPKVAQKRLADLAKQKAEEELKRKKIEEEARLEREAAAKAAREAAEAARLETARIKAETDAKLEKMRQEEEAEKERLRIEAEKQAAEAKAKADAAAAAEAKKRYPIEQKMRAEYAARKISAIKFDLKDYFILDRKLLTGLNSAIITETAWRQMRKAAKNRNWLEVLSIASGERFKDYPDIQEIDEIIMAMLGRKYHAEFKWKTQMSLVQCDRFSEHRLVSFKSDNGTGDEYLVEFSPLTTGKILVHEVDVGHELCEARCRYGATCNEIARSVKLGKISKDAAAHNTQREFEKFKRKVLSIMTGRNTQMSESEDFGSSESSEDFGSGGNSTRARVPSKKKREIDPSLKTFRGPTSVW